MFASKVVLITGASSGIGAVTAQSFCKEGAFVAIVGRNEDKLKDVAKNCEKFGGSVLVIKADISKDDEAKTMVEETLKKFGKLDVLVNSAGAIKFASITDSNVMDIYDEIMNVNLRAIVCIIHLAAPYLKETKGNIVNISSINSTKGVLPLVAVYNMSKAGVDHFTRSAALEFASFGVRVNSVNPGPVNTNQAEKLSFPDGMLEKYKELCSNIPLGRLVEPEEVSDLILFLASDKAKSITGSCYVIDNGTLLY